MNGWTQDANPPHRRRWQLDAPIAWSALHRAFFDEIGLSAHDFLYQFGVRLGDELSRALPNPPRNDASTVMRAGLIEVQERGYGRATLSASSAEQGISVVVPDSLEAWSAGQSGARFEGPTCRMMAGLLAGLWNHSLAKARVRAEDIVGWEVACVANGAPACRFEIGPAAELRERGLTPNAPSGTVRWQLVELARNLDLTRQRADSLDHELRQRVAAYQNLLDHMTEVLIVVDSEMRLAFANRRYQQLTGKPLEELLGKSPVDRVLEEDRASILAVYRALLAGDQGEATYMFRAPSPNGVRYFESSARAMPGPDGTAYIEAIARDVTERELGRLELEEAHREVIRKQRSADRDLRTAKLVHESLLPTAESLPEIELDVQYLPADRVGGDYCHVAFPEAHGRRYCQLTVCDVSGHGMAAALLAARVDSHVRHWSQTRGASQPDPLALAAALNKFLRRYFVDTGMFVTAFSLVMDLASGETVYCGAGHPSVLRLRAATGEVDMLESQNLPLGISDEFVLMPGASVAHLEPGDRLLLYTDGITDVPDVEGRAFGGNGLADALRDLRKTRFFDVGPALLQRVRDYAEGDPADDICLMLLERKRG